MREVTGWFRHYSANWLTGGLHLVILGGAAQADSAAVWRYALATMALVSFAAWIGNYRRQRQIADTPTSNIASAAQGYVELDGRAEQLPGAPLLSKLTGLPCIWFHYEIHRKLSGNKWSLEEAGDSDEPFVIKDATGQCMIDPQGAEVVTSRKQTWTKGNHRYTEWLLLPRERVYALGEFATIGGANSDFDLDADVGALLAEWKTNRPELLKRFDLDQDGAIDLKEWELARRQARREVAVQHREIRTSDGTHVLRQPADGRLFLLSNHLQDGLVARYRLWAWLHVAIFCGAAGVAFALI